MSSPLDDEIRGDWNNLKGTEYHLVYVLWLLLCKNAYSVAFYQGNDLLANPISPTIPNDANLSISAIHAEVVGEDDWIQLKATREPWTLTTLFADNLLFNFICNAAASETAGKAWQISLITQGRVDRTEIEKFVAHPEVSSKLYPKLRNIVTKAQHRLQENSDQLFDQAWLQTLALNILGQIALQEPLSLAQLKAEVDLQLSYLYVTPRLVQQTGNALLGALLQDAAGGPATARVYNHAWTDQIAGTPLKSRLPFDIDPIKACDQAVQDAWKLSSIHWDASHYAERTKINKEFHRFLRAPETLFVLLGMSGTGKSWVVADWAGNILQGHARLLLPGADLDHADQRVLSYLVAQCLRPFTSSPISDGDLLLKLEAGARLEGCGPLLIIIDDIQPIGESQLLRRDFGKIVEQCRKRKIKLVLTAQTHIWDYYRLDQEIVSSDIYRPDQEVFQENISIKSSNVSQSLSSFVLPDLVPEEQSAALYQRLPFEEAKRLSHLFRSPAFALVRRPYFLERYLEQHQKQLQKGKTELLPVNIDELLDSRLNNLLLRVASLLNIDEQEIVEAFTALKQELWLARPEGLSRVTAEKCLQSILSDWSGPVLNAFRQVGIFTARGKIRFADTPLAERVFARMLNDIYKVGHTLAKDNIIQQLRLTDDAGVVSAFIRSVAQDNNPVLVAEMLLKRDLRWALPVAEGLAQCSSQDYRVLAFLTTLTQYREEEYKKAGCTALGQLAAQGSRQRENLVCAQRAFEWVLQSYIGTGFANRLHGGYSFNITLDLAPERVELAIRLRLSRVLKVESRKQWLHNALLPLWKTNDSLSAHIGKRVLARYTFSKTVKDLQSKKLFMYEIDEARGSIAAFDDDEMKSIRMDLRSHLTETRLHAASTFRNIMFDQPERIQDDICEAIKNESDWRVMNRLLWATYRLTELIPDRILDALLESFALQWTSASPSVGIALATLSNLARKIPERVISLLPKQVTDFDVQQRLWLGEGLAFAWWTCAEYSNIARDVLAELAIPHIPDVPAALQLFAWRGAIIAQLGLMSMDIVSVEDLHGQQVPYPEMEMRFFIVNATAFVQKYASTLLSQPGIDKLLDLLVSCLSAENHTLINPAAKALLQAHHFCAFFTMEMFMAFASACPNPVSLLQRLPRNWRVINVTHRLIIAGKKDPALLSFARELCNVPASGGDVQELGEREELFATIIDFPEDPAFALQEMRTNFPLLPFTADSRAKAFAGLADKHLREMLDLLSQSIANESDLAALSQWVAQIVSWQGILIARVYIRMFDVTPLSRTEAFELCQQMLEGVGGLPASVLQQDYLTVYGALSRSLQTKSPLASASPLQDTRESMVNRSHAFALELLQYTFSQQKADQEWQTKLVDILVSAYDKGWWQKEGIILSEGTVMTSTSRELVYVFPAVRLALVAIAGTNKRHFSDPAAYFLTQRETITNHLSRSSWQQESTDFALLLSFLTELEAENYIAVDDERVRQLRGLLALKLGDLSKAESELKRCLSMPSCTDTIRPFAWYNLACTYSLMGQEELCRAALSNAVGFRPVFRQTLRDDPDFAGMQNFSWFQDLLGE